MSRAQYQYTLTGTDPKEVGDWAAKLAAATAARRCCATSPPKRRTTGLRLNIQVDREVAGRLGVSMQTVVDTLSDAFGQRQISTIYGSPTSTA